MRVLNVFHKIYSGLCRIISSVFQKYVICSKAFVLEHFSAFFMSQSKTDEFAEYIQSNGTRKKLSSSNKNDKVTVAADLMPGWESILEKPNVDGVEASSRGSVSEDPGESQEASSGNEWSPPRPFSLEKSPLGSESEPEESSDTDDASYFGEPSGSEEDWRLGVC